ncbi:MAG: SMC-Scp complex subunit ScpB [Planctomycetota bacterium]
MTSDPKTYQNDDDHPEQPQWPDDEGSRKQRLEAVLFMSRMPQTSRKLSQLAHLEDGTQARTMIKQLNDHYDQTGTAFYIFRVGGGYQMRTRSQFSTWIQQMEHVPVAKRLSNSAMETLTVVAYRQPIIKAEVEAIRGVSSGEMLRQLIELGYVKMAGRSEKLGRPFLYATTKKFFADFGFNSLNELPRSKQLSGNGLPQWATSDENLSRLNSSEDGQEETKSTEEQPRSEEE